MVHTSHYVFIFISCHIQFANILVRIFYDYIHKGYWSVMFVGFFLVISLKDLDLMK